MAIYKREGLVLKSARHALLTSHLSPSISSSHAITETFYSRTHTNQEGIGKICAAEVTVNGGWKIHLTAAYIHPEVSLQYIKFFMTTSLCAYSFSVADIFPEIATKKYSQMPLIVTGDFNLDMLKQENKQFLDFMRERFIVESVQTTPTTLGGTCLDLMLVGNADATSMPFISYFSYHRPIISICKPK